MLKPISTVTVLLVFFYLGSCGSADQPTEPPTGTLSGHVYIANSQEPLSGVLVSCASQSYITVEDGYYEFTCIPQDRHQLCAQKEEYEDYSVTVSITESGIWSIYMVPLVRFTDLSGTVTHRIDGPLGNANVCIAGQETETDDQGHYAFANLPHGSHLMTVEHPDYCHFQASITLYKRIQEYDAFVIRGAEIGVPIVQDTYVSYRYAEDVNANFGQASYLYVGSQYRSYTLIRFPNNCRPYSWAQFDSAKLNLYFTQAPTGTGPHDPWPACFTIHAVANEWREATVTWQNRPDAGSLLYDYAGDNCVPHIPQQGIWHEIDVTHDINHIWQGYDNLGYYLLFVPNEGYSIGIISSENSIVDKRPYLNISCRY